MKFALAPGVLLLGVLVCVHGENVFDILQRKEEFSKFYEIAQRDQTVLSVLQHKSVTLFVPVNRAVEEAEDRLTNLNNVASYHILMQLADKSIFPTSVQSFLSASAPLFLNTHQVEGTGTTEYYVNNALITETLELRSSENGKQLMHVIDEILEPFVSSTGYPVDALNFLSNPNVYNVREDVGAFAGRVRAERQENIFQQPGNHTFFIPVGDSDSMNKLLQVDAMVIQGHMIPNQVIFTRIMGSEAYKSRAYNEDIKVEISLVNSTISNDGPLELKVKSNTLQSGPKHRKGVVLSGVERANIPVKNGVVHLIKNPLMIIDITVWQFIQSELNGRLMKLNQLINFSPDFRFEVMSKVEKTIFAPTNDAIERLGTDTIKTLTANLSAITNLLKLHGVKMSVSTDDVKSRRITELMSLDNTRKLYFSTQGDERNRTLVVQGGGVNAFAVQADVGATDGIIHIIDRVLGMPYLTVYETLKETESELNETYQLSSQDNWNMQLKDIEKKFTFFAPSNTAWDEMRKQMPTPYKQLQMGSYQHYVHKILDRHLLVGRALNLHDLMKEEELQMTNAVFKIEKGFKDDELWLAWENLRARISRPDVQATNGIIHIIDKVLMKNRDLIKSHAAPVTFTASLVALLLGLLLTVL